MEQRIVNVAEYRRVTGRVWKINTDLHACCTVGELENWEVSAQKVLIDAQSIACKRARADDVADLADAIKMCQNYIKNLPISKQQVQDRRKRI